MKYFTSPVLIHFRYKKGIYLIRTTEKFLHTHKIKRSIRMYKIKSKEINSIRLRFRML